MTLFDYIMILNIGLALWRQIAIAHIKISNFVIGLVMNVGFTIGYVSIGLWSGLVFSIMHTILTCYGWYCWNKEEKINVKKIKELIK